MGRLFLATIIVFVTMTIGLYAQEEKAQEDPEMTLELIYKQAFSALVGPEEFPPQEIKQILKQEGVPREDKDWMLNSLRIEIAKREGILYTNEGKTIELPEDLKSITSSKNLKFMIVYASHYDLMGMSAEDVRNLQGARNEMDKKIIEWRAKWAEATPIEKEIFADSFDHWVTRRDSLMALHIAVQKNTREIRAVMCLETETGRVLWKEEGSINTFTGKGEDIVSPSYISDDGKTVIAVPGAQFFSTVIFYDEKGNEKKRVTGLWGPQRAHAMSADGEMFCAITRMNHDDTSSMAVAAYDNNGNQLWKTAVKGDWPFTVPCIAISPNHKYVAASVRGTNLLIAKGQITNTYNCGTYKPGFSANDKYVMLGTPRDTVYFVQTDNGEVLWKKGLGGQPLSRPTVAKEGRAIFYTDGYLLDKGGNIVWQSKDELKNAIGISPSGVFMIPSTNPEVIIYRISLDAQNENQ